MARPFIGGGFFVKYHLPLSRGWPNADAFLVLAIYRWPLQDSLMRRDPKRLLPAADGQAHLFFSGSDSPRIMAISTTGCIAIQTPANPVQVFHWYYRSKGKDPISLPPTPWLILWSCRAPWHTERCGHITRLQVANCGLTSMDVRELTRLAHLRCAANLLERLDCSNMETLQSLDCTGNDLTHLDVAGCHRLARLRVGGNPRLRESASQLLAIARGEPRVIRRQRLTSTSLFDL